MTGIYAQKNSLLDIHKDLQVCGFLQDIKACPWLYQHLAKHRMNHTSSSTSYRYVGSRPKVPYTRTLRTQVHHQSSSCVPLYQWLQGCQSFSYTVTISKSSMTPTTHKCSISQKKRPRESQYHLVLHGIFILAMVTDLVHLFFSLTPKVLSQNSLEDEL